MTSILLHRLLNPVSRLQSHASANKEYQWHGNMKNNHFVWDRSMGRTKSKRSAWTLWAHCLEQELFGRNGAPEDGPREAQRIGVKPRTVKRKTPASIVSWIFKGRGMIQSLPILAGEEDGSRHNLVFSNCRSHARWLSLSLSEIQPMLSREAYGK